MEIEENKIKQIATRSEYFQDILDKIPLSITVWGNTAILILFLLVALGLRLIKYPDIISSAAMVTTEKPPVEIYSRTSGRVTHLLKSDLDRVKKGDWVIVLNNSADYRQVLKAMTLVGKVDPADFWKSVNTVAFEDLTSLGDLQSTYFQFYKSVEEFKLFEELNAQYRQLDINSRRGNNLTTLRQRLTSQLEMLREELALVKLDYERNKKLHTDGYIPKTELEQKEIAFLRMTERLEELNVTLLNVQLQKDALEKENTSLDVEKNDTYFKLRSNVLQYYNNFMFQLSEWQNKYVLASPIDGTINLYEIRSSDQFLAQEQKVFTVTPIKAQHYFALIKLPISNSGKVRTGQTCIIKLHNYPYTEFGLLKGTIQAISTAPKEGFYSVKVLLPQQLTTTTHKQLQANGELSGVAEIIIEDLTLFDRLFNIFTSKNY